MQFSCVFHLLEQHEYSSKILLQEENVLMAWQRVDNVTYGKVEAGHIRAPPTVTWDHLVGPIGYLKVEQGNLGSPSGTIGYLNLTVGGKKSVNGITSLWVGTPTWGQDHLLWEGIPSPLGTQSPPCGREQLSVDGNPSLWAEIAVEYLPPQGGIPPAQAIFFLSETAFIT